MSRGTPYRQMMFFQANRCVAAALILATGFASTHLEKYSMATKANQRLLLAGGYGPMMSSPHRAKGQTGGRGCSESAGALGLRLAHWHPWQRWTRSYASWSAVGQ